MKLLKAICITAKMPLKIFLIACGFMGVLYAIIFVSLEYGGQIIVECLFLITFLIAAIWLIKEFVNDVRENYKKLKQ